MSCSRQYFLNVPFHVDLNERGCIQQKRKGEEKRREKAKKKRKIKPHQVSYLASLVPNVIVGSCACYCNQANASGLIHSLSVFILSPVSLAAFTVVTVVYFYHPIFSPSKKL